MISSRDRESVYEALNVSNYLKQCDFTIQVLIFIFYILIILHAWNNDLMVAANDD